MTLFRSSSTPICWTVTGGGVRACGSSARLERAQGIERRAPAAQRAVRRTRVVGEDGGMTEPSKWAQITAANPDHSTWYVQRSEERRVGKSAERGGGRV